MQNKEKKQNRNEKNGNSRTKRKWNQIRSCHCVQSIFMLYHQCQLQNRKVRSIIRWHRVFAAYFFHSLRNQRQLQLHFFVCHFIRFYSLVFYVSVMLKNHHPLRNMKVQWRKTTQFIVENRNNAHDKDNSSTAREIKCERNEWDGW